MATIGRPKGQRGHNPVRHDAMNNFSAWRRDGEELSITQDRAFALTNGAVGEAGNETKVPLSSVALRYSIHIHKRKG